jgi:hypothetical protein
MVVLLVNFKDASVECNANTIGGHLWKDTLSGTRNFLEISHIIVKTAYESNSFGTIEFYGDLEGIFTLP